MSKYHWFSLSPRSQMFIITIIIFIPITEQPEQDRLAENQPPAGLSSLNEYEYEDGMRKSETEFNQFIFWTKQKLNKQWYHLQGDPFESATFAADHVQSVWGFWSHTNNFY